MGRVSLFNGYLFVKPTSTQRDEILETTGVVAYLRYNGQDATVKEKEIQVIHTILESGYSLETIHTPDDFEVGNQVMVDEGPLKGQLVDILRRNNESCFLVSFETLGQSIKVELPYHVFRKTNNMNYLILDNQWLNYSINLNLHDYYNNSRNIKLEKKLKSLENQKIGIIGLGYVGLPLAVEFGKKYVTLGYDINTSRIDSLRSGIDSTLEVDKAGLLSATQLTYTDNILDLSDCTIYIVTVPTPIDQNKRPDLGPLEKSSHAISQILKKDDIVIYESTVFPGCTEEVCVPVLEQGSGLVYNTDFYCGYSPERINPGDKVHTVTKIKKVTSGSTVEVAELVDQLYQSIITAGTFKASSIKVAEGSKVIENCQRDLNISFVNELALIFDRIGIDTLEVLEAAGSKWNFFTIQTGTSWRALYFC